MLPVQVGSLPSSCRLPKAFTASARLVSCRASKLFRANRSIAARSQRLPLFTCRAEQSTTLSATSVSNDRTSVPSSDVWELDFCSRPLLDERGKKIWEVYICDPAGTFTYSQYLPSNKINSAELKTVIEGILSQPGAVKPDKCRFFRGQMQTIISKALTEIGVKALPSRRCFTLMSKLQERFDTVYSVDPRYSSKAQSLFTIDMGSPEPTPDALRGEQWAFVQLPLSTLQEMLKQVDSGDIFGSNFELSSISADALTKDTLIPGVAVFSRRALPLAAWTNGLELAALSADVARSCLILETGVNQRWRYGAWRTTPDSIEEAEAWEEAKKEVKGVHFLAIQPDPDSQDVTGLWLLNGQMPPNV